MTLICNLYGSPGSGKSTTRAGAFNKLKLHGVHCEEVFEFAKTIVWEGRKQVLGCQPYVFGKQLWAMERLYNQVDVILTDSPILLSAYYGRRECGNRYPESLWTAIEDIAKQQNAINFFLRRTKRYNPKGRNQTEAESDEVHFELMAMLDRLGISYLIIDGDMHAAYKVAQGVMYALGIDPAEAFAANHRSAAE